MSAPPRHVAVIPDGNRRWARARGLPTERGHREGIDVVGRVAAAAWERGVETFTFWWGSPANLEKRAADEVRAITAALGDWLGDRGAALLRAHDAAFEVHGRWRELCPEIEPGLERARAAMGRGPRRLVLLMAYDGREEILAAAETLGGRASDIETFGRAMWTGALPPVDLLIRTGGEPHLSAGFMLWRIAEAQLAWPDELWPDFTPERLAALIDEYGARERRFGA